MSDDYYRVLGVNPSANPQSIQAAYRKLAKACHPDHAGADGTEKFQLLQEAYEVLSDPDKREAYDSQFRHEHYRQVRYDTAPEPLVPVPDPRSVHPEPLVQRSSLPEPFSDMEEEHCLMCHQLGHEREMTCVFCDARHGIASELLVFVRHWRTPFGY